ncbi:ABC transporter ATP-binding protein [Pseudalkalibacillus caeni]|uniref:ABC transporter ATP-binding protein n=1 Tax=Exobacillus caeni TaxID=2574798 RepID=A0A5R9F0Q3_9BACL|nr:ABC transporter ATP-binding protein [Pseudalkalibacillus caeni]TLS35990.1 ABC transporter ATP-binding protein [Pseudalkalibacillus caeni]
MNVIECKGLTKVYGKTKALNDISFTLTENKITGLIGRNGAGKTTLLKIISGYLKETSGEVKVFSESPFNNLKVSANLIFVNEEMSYPGSLNLGEILKAAATFYENLDMELAERLMNYFSLDLRQYHTSLSKGMRSTFNTIVGISSRCALTVYDEPTSGMDAGVRKDFYRALLKDYIAYPRTILLSSHLLNEVEDILEDILLIKSGEKYLHMAMGDLKEYAIALSGRSVSITKWAEERKVIFQKSLGAGSSYIVVKNDLSALEIEQARNEGIELMPVSADDLCVYLTNKTIGGIDDVFSRS